MKFRNPAGIAFFFVSCSYAQTSARESTFEVASIRPTPAFEPGKGIMPGFHGGPGTRDPGLYTCNNCTLLMLIAQAYGITLYSEILMPDSMPGAFNISAKVPEKTTKEQFRLMLQNLLADRFKLAVRREKKEMPVYELVVAKGGPKMRESTEEPLGESGKDDEPPLRPVPVERAATGLDGDGFPIRPNCNGCLDIGFGGRARMRYSKTIMDDFCKRLSGVVGGKTVVDATGLKAKYDFTLTWDFSAKGDGGVPSPPGADTRASEVMDPPATDLRSGQTVTGAIESQLGLKLVEKKAQVEILVVVHAERNPTEN
jgi:uncharacterized protein (TIGR03435 family)